VRQKKKKKSELTTGEKRKRTRDQEVVMKKKKRSLRIEGEMKYVHNGDKAQRLCQGRYAVAIGGLKPSFEATGGVCGGRVKRGEIHPVSRK